MLKDMSSPLNKVLTRSGHPPLTSGSGLAPPAPPHFRHHQMQQPNRGSVAYEATYDDYPPLKQQLGGGYGFRDSRPPPRARNPFNREAAGDGMDAAGKQTSKEIAHLLVSN